MSDKEPKKLSPEEKRAALKALQRCLDDPSSDVEKCLEAGREQFGNTPAKDVLVVDATFLGVAPTDPGARCLSNEALFQVSAVNMQKLLEAQNNAYDMDTSFVLDTNGNAPNPDMPTIKLSSLDVGLDQETNQVSLGKCNDHITEQQIKRGQGIKVEMTR